MKPYIGFLAILCTPMAAAGCSDSPDRENGGNNPPGGSDTGTGAGNGDSVGEAVIVSCRFQLFNIDEAANPDFTNIYFDGEPLARGDECTGEADWIWGNEDRTIIEFCADACNAVENDLVENLRVIIMCSEDDVVVV